MEGGENGRSPRKLPDMLHRPGTIPTCENPWTDPARNRTRFALVGGERFSHSTTVAPLFLRAPASIQLRAFSVLSLFRALSDELRRPESVLSDVIKTSSREREYERALPGPIETRPNIVSQLELGGHSVTVGSAHSDSRRLSVTRGGPGSSSLTSLPPTMDRWRGKVAVVTGASVGIGAAVVQALVRHGLKVVGMARSLDKMQAYAQDLKKAPGEFHPVKVDMTKEADILEAFQWVRKNLGVVHVLVNNAGVAYEARLLGEASLCIRYGPTEQWRQIVETNILGYNICTREAYQIMKDKGVDDGHIINMNRRTGFKPRPVHSGFSQVGIVTDDAAGRRVFSGISRFPCSCIPVLLHTHLASPSLALKAWLGGAVPYRLPFRCRLRKCTQLSGDKERCVSLPTLSAVPLAERHEVSAHSDLTYIMEACLAAGAVCGEGMTSSGPGWRGNTLVSDSASCLISGARPCAWSGQLVGSQLEEGGGGVPAGVCGHCMPHNYPFIVYLSTKHAITALTEGLRRELTDTGSHIKVTSLSPGTVKTDIMYRNNTTTVDPDKVYSKHPYLSSEDIADSLVYVLGTPPNVQVSD
ncbi:hypothetical protein PR048_029432 [Dryococelus australis]|uniref:Uncharacterized protein n=1 Tax=Dryococelus australis TaxID=614101 RepID=A0ABQ9GDD4_9NEOP|nr:hypothetical protein PR048_029432 [Dryococelus australis]